MLHSGPLRIAVGSHSYEFTRDPFKVGVVYDDRLSRTERLSVERETLGRAPPIRFEVPGARMTLIDYQTTPAEQRVGPFATEAAINGRAEVEATFPVFIMGDKRIVLTPQITVGFDPAVTNAEALAQAANLTLVSKGADYVVLGLPANADVQSVAQQVSMLPGVVFSEPDLVTIGSRLRLPALDGITPFAAQAAIQQAFQNIAAPAAWTKAGPLSPINVAVLDDGVDTTHPALANTVAGSFDATTSTAGASPNSWDYHGTACAGLIVAEPDGSNFRGIASGARLLAVRIAASPGIGQPWSTSNSILRAGLDWAVDNGAHVISNSWGGPPSNVIAGGVSRANAVGRGGKGAVVVVAAGNSGGPVEFPATLTGAIAVGAVNLADEPKTRTSSDGENWWASNQGPEMDIAAPAVRIQTTDIAGGGGRNPTDWRDDFNGTSAACPMVAGAAALVLSVAPSITAGEVAQVLTNSADKLASQASGHDPIVGSGRLNIAAALERAGGAASVIGRLSKLSLSDTVDVFHVAIAADGAALFLPHPADLTLLSNAENSAQDAEVTYASRIETPAGFVLRDARLVTGNHDTDTTPDTDTPSEDSTREPLPGEVLLPSPEDDVFRGSSLSPAAADGEPLPRTRAKKPRKQPDRRQ